MAEGICDASSRDPGHGENYQRWVHGSPGQDLGPTSDTSVRWCFLFAWKTKGLARFDSSKNIAAGISPVSSLFSFRAVTIEHIGEDVFRTCFSTFGETLTELSNPESPFPKVYRQISKAAPEV